MAWAECHWFNVHADWSSDTAYYNELKHPHGTFLPELPATTNLLNSASLEGPAQFLPD